MRSLFVICPAFVAAIAVTMFTPLSACSGEASGQYSEQRLNEAKKQYVRLFLATLEKMQQLHGLETLTEAELSEKRQAITEWLDRDLIPFLREQGVLNDFIECQLDTELLEMHELALRTKSRKVFWDSLCTIDARVEKKYPRIYQVKKTEQYRKVVLLRLFSKFPARNGVFRMPYELTVRVPKGEEQILAELSGALERFGRTVTTNNEAARLEFRLVHEDSDRLVAQGCNEFNRKNPNGNKADEKKFLEGNAPTGYSLLSFSGPNLNGQIVRRYYYVSQNVEMDGERVCKASVGKDQWGIPSLNLSFDNGGAEEFAELSGKNIGRQLAIVINGRLRCAPCIRAAITGGDISVTGAFTEEEAKSLVNSLTGKKRPCDIKFEISRGMPECGCSYTITVGKTGIIIRSHTRDGLRRGARKLCGMLRAAPSPEIKACVISE